MPPQNPSKYGQLFDWLIQRDDSSQVAPPPPTPPSPSSPSPKLDIGLGAAVRNIPNLASKLGIESGSPLGRAAQFPGQVGEAIGAAPGQAWQALAKNPPPQPPQDPSIIGLQSSQQPSDINLPNETGNIDPRLSAFHKPPTQTVGGTEYPAGRGPSAVLGASPVPFKIGLTTPEDRADLQATRQRMGTNQAMAGLEARSYQPTPEISEWEMTQRASLPDESRMGGVLTARAPGAQDYWTRHLSQRTGAQDLESGRENQRYNALHGALTGQMPAVAGFAEQEAQRAAIPAYANAQASLNAAKAAATSREEVAEIEADDKALKNATDRLVSLDDNIAQVQSSTQGRSNEGQAQIQQWTAEKAAWEAYIAAFSEPEGIQ